MVQGQGPGGSDRDHIWPVGDNHHVKLALFSAIYGDYESTVKPLPEDLPVPAYMFTDNPGLYAQAGNVGWQPILDTSAYTHFEANPANGDPEVVRPMLAHKWWKTHPIQAMDLAWETYRTPVPDGSVWIDGSMLLNCSGPEFVERNLAALGDDDWSLMAHPWRRCLFEEAVYSSTLIFRYDSAAMMRQHDHYESLGHPRSWGLFATGHMVRRHTDLIRRVNHHWWDENVAWSHQDQISLPVLIRLFKGWEGLKWNQNLPWADSWSLLAHGS